MVIPTPLPQLDNISSESEVKNSEISLIDQPNEEFIQK
jgi:hypothetical protein